MNSTVLSRLAWKECRTLMPLWLSIFGITIALSAALPALVADDMSGRLQLQILSILGHMMPVIYALACVALMFAGERDDGTDQLLCRLGVAPSKLLGVKYGMCLVTVALMAVFAQGLMWASIAMRGDMAHLASQGWGNQDLVGHRFNALAWGVCALSWGLLFSLLCRRVMNCVVATIAASVVSPLLFPFIEFWAPESLHAEVVMIVNAIEMPVRFGVLPLSALVLSVWLVQRWDEGRWPTLIETLLTRQQRWGRVGAAAPTLPQSAIKLWLSNSLTLRWGENLRPFGSRELGRLLWLEWRGARRLFLGCVSVGFVIAGLAALGPQSIERDFAAIGLPIVLWVMCLLFGVGAFYGDQRQQQFRLMAGHGVTPSVVWFVKQFVWSSMAFVTTAVVISIAELLISEVTTLGAYFYHTRPELMPYHRWIELCGNFCGFDRWMVEPWNVEHWQHLEFPIVWLLGCVAVGVWLLVSIGQFVCLLIPRTVAAGITAVALGTVASGVMHLAWFFNVPLVCSILPLIVGLQLTVWMRLSDWLEERNSWRSWLKVAGGLGGTVIVLLLGVISYRVFEYPEVPASDLARNGWFEIAPESEAAKTTAQEWIRLSELITTPDDTPESKAAFEAWVDENRHVVEAADRLAEQRICGRIRMDHSSRLHSLASVLAELANREILNGDLPEATRILRALCHLSLHVAGGGSTLEYHFADQMKARALSLIEEFILSPQVTAMDLRLIAGLSEGGVNRSIRHLLQTDPHFYLRGMIVADYHDAQKALVTEEHQVAIWRWLPWELTRARRLLNHQTRQAFTNVQFAETRVPDLDAAWQGNKLEQRIRASHDPYRMWLFSSHSAAEILNRNGQRFAQQRTLQVLAALRLHQLEHGSLPARLDDLVGPYLVELPCDPITGRSFVYEPTGYPTDIDFRKVKVPAGTPVLWTSWPEELVVSRVLDSESQPGTPAPNFRWRTTLSGKVITPSQHTISDTTNIIIIHQLPLPTPAEPTPNK